MMEKTRSMLSVILVLILFFVMLPAASASWTSIIYRGEDVVDGYIFHYNVLEYKKYELYRDGNKIEDWVTQTSANLYFSDAPSVGEHTYLLKTWTRSDPAFDWDTQPDDSEIVDTTTINGTLHNNLNWQLRLNRGEVEWDNTTDPYKVGAVTVADGTLSIYSGVTVNLNDPAYFLKAEYPGEIYAMGPTFTTDTATGGTVEFRNQTQSPVYPIEGCTFNKINMNLDNHKNGEVTNSTFIEAGVTLTGDSTGNLIQYNNITNEDFFAVGIDIAGSNCNNNTVKENTVVGDIDVNGDSNTVEENRLRAMDLQGDTNTVRKNTFGSSAYNGIRLTIVGSSNQVLENTLEHREADSGHPISILGDINTVQGNVITEYVAGVGAWGTGIGISGNNNTVQLNRITGKIANLTTNNFGIVLGGDCTGNLVKKNTIKNCQNGIDLAYPYSVCSNNIENNAISSTTRAAIDVAENCNDNVIAFNHIWNGSTGMYIEGSGNGIHENIIDDCSSRGIELLAGAANTWVYNNVFRNNYIHAVDQGTGNYWNKPKTAVNSNIVGGPYLGGNYWDDYTGHDTDGDKLGDIPRPISGTAGSFDELPLIWVSMPSPSPGPTPAGPGAVVSGDYNGDGTDDLAIFRSSSGLWAVRGVTRAYFGSGDDSPVCGDYNGDMTTDIAIFRGSAGLWAVRAVTRVYFGGSSDLPVAGDYNGDGSCDIGIFRGSSGLWAARGVTRVYFGTDGDTAVPGDYNGDGNADLAIFRGSSGLWALRGISRIYFGASGDIPVPGDYNGVGKRVPAIFRPGSGLWAVRTVTRVYFGSSVDQPVPADFNGDGADNAGIFRESSGLWAIRGITRAYFGTSGDIPVTR